MNNLIAALQKNRTAITLTFKIFWIIIFVLEMIGTESGSGIPQFVYVNF